MASLPPHTRALPASPPRGTRPSSVTPLGLANRPSVRPIWPCRASLSDTIVAADAGGDAAELMTGYGCASAYLIGILFTCIVLTLYRVQNDIEDPFDGVGLSDVRCCCPPAPRTSPSWCPLFNSCLSRQEMTGQTGHNQALVSSTPPLDPI